MNTTTAKTANQPAPAARGPSPRLLTNCGRRRACLLERPRPASTQASTLAGHDHKQVKGEVRGRRQGGEEGEGIHAEGEGKGRGGVETRKKKKKINDSS